jgi:hypothetical protein
MADDTPLLDTLAAMTAASVASCNLEPRELMLARIAALVAVDAPQVSYLVNAGLASEVGVTLRIKRPDRDRSRSRPTACWSIRAKPHERGCSRAPAHPAVGRRLITTR